MKRATRRSKPKVMCSECKFAVGYTAMYSVDDPRKWGTSRCVRNPKRVKRVRTLIACEGCDKGVKKEAATLTATVTH